MTDYSNNREKSTFSMQSFLQVIRAMGAFLGIVAVIIGLVYATRIFGLIFNVLQAPEAFGALLNKWTETVGGDELNIDIAGTTYHGARIIAISVLGCGISILAWIAMGIIKVGAKTISWTLSDREAVKKILTHAFGSTAKPNTGK